MIRPQAQWLKRNQETSNYLMSMLDLRRARRLLLLHKTHRLIGSDARPESVLAIIKDESLIKRTNPSCQQAVISATKERLA